MNILITGAKGFVGRNLVENLRTIKDGRNKTYPELTALPSTSPIKENSREIHTVHQTKTYPQSTSSQNPQNTIEAIYEYDLDTPPEKLDDYCRDCDIVFNLAGVNRPKDNEEFMKGNFGFASTLLDTLKKHNNKCPVMLSSSIQATLEGRFKDSEYGKSKKAGEELFFEYAKETGAPVLIYRFPNLFGK